MKQFTLEDLKRAPAQEPLWPDCIYVHPEELCSLKRNHHEVLEIRPDGEYLGGRKLIVLERLPECPRI